MSEAHGVDLSYHGDRDVAPGLLDLAVNVRSEPPPAWLTDAIVAACGSLASYPDPSAATAAVAAYHARPADQVLLTAGAAEAFGLIARAFAATEPPASRAATGGSASASRVAAGGGAPARRAVVVHPQFTEPERALRLAGHAVHRHVLRADDGFRLDPAQVPPDADLVVVGNPTNPTGVLHPASDLVDLARPGRVLVVDEAFMDAVPGEPASLASRHDVPGLVVVRSLTKTWGLAGLRIGYLLAAAPLVAALRAQQPPWSVSTPALAAALACTTGIARAESRQRAAELRRLRLRLAAGFAARGLWSPPGGLAPFLLVRDPRGRSLTPALRRLGIAVRRADTFPGLGPDWFRVAVRDEPAQDALLRAIDALPDLESVPDLDVLPD